jgi:hypothetical protein
LPSQDIIKKIFKHHLKWHNFACNEFVPSLRTNLIDFQYFGLPFFRVVD